MKRLWLVPYLLLTLQARAVPSSFDRQTAEMASLYKSLETEKAWKLLGTLQKTPLSKLPAASQSKLLLSRAHMLYRRSENHLAELSLDYAFQLAAGPAQKARINLMRAREALDQNRFRDLDGHLQAVVQFLARNADGKPHPEIVLSCLTLRARFLTARGEADQAYLLLEAARQLPGASQSWELEIALAELSTHSRRGEQARAHIDKALRILIGGNDWEAIVRTLSACDGDNLFQPRLIPSGSQSAAWELAWGQQIARDKKTPPLVRLWALRWLVTRAPDAGRARLAPRLSEIEAVQHPMAAMLFQEALARQERVQGKNPQVRVNTLFRQALKLRLFADHPLYRWLSSAALGETLAALQVDRNVALQTLQEGLIANQTPGDWLNRQGLHCSKLELQLDSLDLEGARATIALILKDMGNSRTPALRLEGMNIMLNAILAGGRDDNSILDNPVDVKPGEPGYYLLRDAQSQVCERLLQEAQICEAEQPGNAAVPLFQGAVSAVLGRTYEAMTADEKALSELSPEDNPVLVAELQKLMAWELQRLHRYEESDAHLKQAIEVCRKAALPFQSVQYQQIRILLKLTTHHYSEALKLADQLLENYPTFTPWARTTWLLLKCRALAGLDRGAEAAHLLETYPPADKDARLVPIVLREAGHLHPDPRQAAADLEKAFDAIYEREISALLAPVAGEYAQTLETLGQFHEAAEVCQKALKRCLELRQLYPVEMRNSASEKSRLDSLLQRFVRLLLHEGRSAEALKWIETADRLQFLPESQSLSTQDPETTRLLKVLEERRLQVGRLGPESPEGQRVAARAEFQTVLNELRSHNPEVDLLAPVNVADLAQLQPKLPEDAAVLVLYPTEEEVVVQLATRDAMRLSEVHVSASDLLARIKLWRKQLQDPADTQLQGMQSPGRRFYEQLLGDVQPLLRDKKRLYIVPAGPLWYLPMDTLVDDKGQFLGERFAISILTSPDLRGLQDPAARAAGPALVLANPTGDLNGAEDEGRDVAAALAGSRLLSGREATLAELQQQAPKARILHLACHATVGAESLNASHLELAGGDASLKDVYGMQLQKGSLVFLSSCQSGIGQEQPGREVASFCSAFRAAGSSSVIASLWKVDDLATRVLIQAFYRELAQGVGPGQALAAAKRELALDPRFKHPYYWAPFFLSGDPR